MLRNYFLINILLVIMLGILGSKLYSVVTYPMDVPTEAAVGDVEKKVAQDIRLKSRVPDKASFQVISGKDLFRPSRSPAPSVSTVTQISSKDHPRLFATIVQEGNSMALMEDPETKKTKMYRIDDTVAGFRVAEIIEDKVVLMAGSDRIVIKLREDKGIQNIRPRTIQRPNPADDTDTTRRRIVPAARRPARTAPTRRGAPDENIPDDQR